MLYLVATPIGNLADITFRAVDTLNRCDYILCEDTRHSRKLIEHYQIKTLLKSYHKFNEAQRKEEILSDLRHGKEIALISDAGTPGISDPGEKLVGLCIKEALKVTAIPGPCALVQALVCSGIEIQPFQFIGFLPKKTAEKRKTLSSLMQYKGTSICYESPHRLKNTLELLEALDSEAFVVVARELTKKFEEFVRGFPSQIIAHFSQAPLKGEIVLLIQNTRKQESLYSELSLSEHVIRLREQKNLTQKEAVKEVATLRGLPKKDVYRDCIKNKS